MDTKVTKEMSEAFRSGTLKGRKKVVSFFPRHFGTGILLALVSVVLLSTAGLAKTGTPEQTPAAEEESIVLDLKGVEITELLRILSTKTNMTIVPSKAVTGRVNIFLNHVSFEDALDILLFTQNLAAETRDGILYVMTSEEYFNMYGRAYQERREYHSIQLKYANPSNVFNAVSQLKSEIGKVIVDEASGSIILIDIPEKLAFMEGVIKQLDTALESRVYDLNYANAETIKEKLAGVLTVGTGKVIVDERSAKLIVSDLPSKMDRIEEAVRNLDSEDDEVFIEAEIVQITLTDDFKRGIQWENVLATNAWDGASVVGEFPVSTALSSYGQVEVGTLSRDDYTSTIQWLKTYGEVKILSRPRIAAMNNQEAKILVGTRDAFVTSTLSQAETTTVTSESIEFVDVGVKLNVVPTINKKGFITLKIKPEVSSVTDTLTTAAGSRVPIVETSEAETIVRVKDGSMIMIAGLMKNEIRNDKSAVPVLGELPIVGAFFSSRESEEKTTELIIFLTPRIISGESSLAREKVGELIPDELMPDDIKNRIIEEELGIIKPVTAEAASDEIIFKEAPSDEDDGLRDKWKGLKNLNE